MLSTNPHPHHHSIPHSIISQPIPNLNPLSYPTTSAHINPNTPTPHHSDSIHSYIYSTSTSTQHTYLNPNLTKPTPTHFHSTQSHLYPPPPLPTFISQYYTLPFRPYKLLPILNFNLYPTYSIPPKPSCTHPTPFNPTYSHLYPSPSLLTSRSQHFTPPTTLPTLTYTQPPPLPTILTSPKPYYNHHTLPTLSSTHLHLYLRTYHNTTPYHIHTEERYFRKEFLYYT